LNEIFANVACFILYSLDSDSKSHHQSQELLRPVSFSYGCGKSSSLTL
jgi:hypothetical protein